MQAHAYLAGPDVFFPDAIAIGARKKAALAAVGITGHFPFDNEIDVSSFGSLPEAACAIARANEQMMLDCCSLGRQGFVLANMTPYHGPSMDVGTGFEVGFMSALASVAHNVVIIGYTEDARLFEDRVIDVVYGGRQNVTERDGILYGNDGRMIEAFGGADNLMITQAVEKTGGRIVESFDAAVALAAQVVGQGRPG